MARLPSEFALIARYFAPLAKAPGALGLKDDVALVEPAIGFELIAKTDAIVAGVHFFPDDPPDTVAKKLLRVNLSDLAAKGARPFGYLLSASLSRRTAPRWLAAFVRGLKADQRKFRFSLLGGDTTATPGPANLTVAMLGWVRAGKLIPRGGARPGDLIFVSGTLGDAAFGLDVQRGKYRWLPPALKRALIARYRVPEPRMELGSRLAGLARASIDVSDGLIADMGHVAEMSRVRAIIEEPRVPLSAAGRMIVRRHPEAIARALTGGDDYEILFTAPRAKAAAVRRAALAAGVRVTEIGRIEKGKGVRVVDARGRRLSLASTGFRHF